ncbi:MAG TPA: hypothetical protein VG602_01160 [Actinomycetota bacterium]|nr:hypothetical protein [Actinomycetota bacterium]
MSGRVAAVGLVLTLGAGACAQDPEADTGGPRVTPLAGQVFLHRGGDVLTLDEETTLAPGERLSTGDGGRAVVDLTGGSIELAPRAEIRLDVDREPELLRGSVLAQTAGSPMALQAGDAEIEAASSVFRVDRDFTVTLAVYQGTANVAGSGIEPVPALRQATIVAGGTVPRGPQPLAVRPNDPWDTKLLGPAIDTGLDLVRLERGLTRQLPRQNVTQAVTAVLSGDFPRSLIDMALRRAPAAEAVVAAAVAQDAARLASTPLASALNRVLALRREGAHWIVVVATWELARAALLRDLSRLTGLIARFVSPRPASGVGSAIAASSSASVGTTSVGGSTPSGGTGGTGGGGAGGGGGGGGSGGGPSPSGGSSGGQEGGDQQPPPEPGCTGVQCVIDDVIPPGGSNPEKGSAPAPDTDVLPLV